MRQLFYVKYIILLLTADYCIVHSLTFVTPKNMEEARQVSLPHSDYNFEGLQDAAKP